MFEFIFILTTSVIVIYLARNFYTMYKNKKNLKNISIPVTVKISTNIPPPIETEEARRIDNNRNKNILFIKVLSKEYHLNTKADEVSPELHNNPSFCHGDRAVKNHIWLYLDEVNKYDPNSFSNLKDALIGLKKISKQALDKLYSVYPDGLSYRTIEEQEIIYAEIVTHVREIHHFHVYDFVNTDIDHLIRATRNVTRYSKIIKRIDKDEVNELIESYIENIINDLDTLSDPLEFEKIVLKKFRPVVKDVSYAYNIEKRPSRWKRESRTAKVAIKLFKGHKIIQQGSPYFLGTQRYDVWIPSLNIAIEYNGKQHYEYVPFFHPNGITDLNKQRERDSLKRTISKDNNIVLIEIPYTVVSIEKFIISYLNDMKVIVAT